MKNFTVFAIAVTCLVACAYGLPAAHRDSSTSSNKWEALADISSKIRTVINGAARRVSSAAKSDNLEIGSRIADNVNASQSQASSIINQLDSAIQSQTLLLEQADVLFQQLNETGLALRENINEDLQQLSATAQITINGILIGNRGAVTGLVVAARAVLIVGIPGGGLKTISSEQSNKYKVLAKLSSDLRLVSSEALNKAVEIAQNDNQEIGSQLQAPVDATLASIASSLDELDAAIAKQSLTLGEAEPLFQNINSSLAQLNEEIEPQLEQLSLTARASVKGLLLANEKVVGGIIVASKLVIVVGVPDIPSVHTSNKYELLAKLAAGIRATINRLADEINKISRNDNAEIGEQIAAVVDGARGSALEVVSGLDASIANESLTLEQASEELAKLNEIDEQLQSDAAEPVSQLSLTARVTVKSLILANSVAVRGQAAAAIAILTVGIPGGH